MTTATKTKTGITLDRVMLQTALSDVVRAVPARSPKPVLLNVRLGDGLLTATDLEIRIDREIDYHGDAILLPAAKLSAILRAATGDEVTITPKGTSVTVKCGGGKWELPTEDAAEFPTWEPEGLFPVCRVPADQFWRAVNATAYATDAHSSRYALGGVLVEVKKGNPTLVGSDGRRLSIAEMETDQDPDDWSIIVPEKAIKIVKDLMSKKRTKPKHDDDGEDEEPKAEFDKDFMSVQVESNKREVRFDLKSCTVTARLLDGRFPETWRDLVKDDGGEPAVFEIKQLAAAVSQAMVVTSEQSKGVNFRWDSDTLVISAKSSEYGASEVKCKSIDPGSAASTRLDPRYVKDFLRGIQADDQPHVDVYIKDAESRVLLKCGPYTGVIMPLAAEG